MPNPSVSTSYPDESFAIPQFQIVANPQSNDTYSLQMVNEIDPKTGQSGLRNELTPIHYDTSFLDDSNHDSEFNPDTIKEEFSTMHEQLALQEPMMDDDDDDNFEIDDFFRIKPKPPQQQQQGEMSQHNEDIKIEGGGQQAGEWNGGSLSAENKEIASTDVVATASESTNDTNDIIQQAAIIDDDFFSQIRESMDVLYDKILC